MREAKCEAKTQKDETICNQRCIYIKNNYIKLDAITIAFQIEKLKNHEIDAKENAMKMQKNRMAIIAYYER